VQQLRIAAAETTIFGTFLVLNWKNPHHFEPILFVQDIVDSANLVDILWLTSGSIPADSEEEIDFWKSCRKLAKNSKTAVRIICEHRISNSEYISRWKERLSGNVIPLRPDFDGVLSRRDVECLLCNDVRWRGLVRCGPYSATCNNGCESKIRSRLRVADRWHFLCLKLFQMRHRCFLKCPSLRRLSLQGLKSYQNLLNCGMNIIVLKGFDNDLPFMMYDTQTLVLETEHGETMKSFLYR
jgi:hypothetical protein